MARQLEEVVQVSKSRLLVTARRESGLWLHTLPTSTLGTLLDSESQSIAFVVKVEADACESLMCRCGQRMNARGLQELSCKFSAVRNSRHAALNDIIKRGLQSAGVSSISILELVAVGKG